MLGRILTIVTLGAMISLLLLFQSTNPSTVGPGGIFAAFFLMYIIFVGVGTWLIRALNWVYVYVLRPLLPRKVPAEEMSMLRAYYFASVVGMAPLMLLGMSSVGAIGIYEVLLVLLFEIVSIFYVRTRFR